MKEKLLLEETKNKSGKDSHVKIETFKTIVITVLLTAILAFVFGMRYQSGRDNQVKSEAANIAKSIKVNVEPSKQ